LQPQQHPATHGFDRRQPRALKKICSAAKDKPSKADAERMEEMNQAMKVVYPASGKLVGDWKKGEAISQSGYGMRVGDPTLGRANGGNC
jgi:L-cysteine S-thiosulfotransferase